MTQGCPELLAGWLCKLGLCKCSLQEMRGLQPLYYTDLGCVCVCLGRGRCCRSPWNQLFRSIEREVKLFAMHLLHQPRCSPSG